MKYSYTWLKELSGTKLPSEKVADLLMMRSFEFEEMKKEGKETQLEFAILPNRAHDMLSHIGMAREICAVEGRKFHFPTFHFPTSDVGKLKIDIKDKNLCSRYIGAVLENIEVKSSPKWMQERLLVSGVKPINNIVDITNYVMLETGQPLHAFDLDKIKSEFPISNFQFPKIIIRKAKKNEEIKLLDEKIYKLNENDLVISDSINPIALAGVMGGIESSVTNKTSSIILESANFNSTNVRKTRTRCNIITESSYRFERDIDPNLAEMGAARAIELLQKYGGNNAKLLSYIDIYPKKFKPWQIKLDSDYVNSLLGEKVPVSKIKNILENLDVKAKVSGKYLNCEIPTRRIDLKTQEDLIEEIGRIYGYENIPSKAPCVDLQTPTRNEKRILEDKLRDIFIGSGFSEVMNYSFYGADDIEKCGLDIKDHFEVANPMNPEQQYMRTRLIPGILKNVELNLKNFENFSIFEMGRIYLDPNAKIPDERTLLAGALVNEADKKNIFFELKGKIEALFDSLGIKNADFVEPKVVGSICHPKRSAIIKLNDKIIGYICEINPKVLSEYKIKTRVAVFELNTVETRLIASLQREYKSISKFPSVKRDISMYVGEKTKYADIESKIYSAGGKLVLGVDLFDIFEKEGEKSMALRIEIGSSAKTLTSEEIDGMMKKIVSKLEKDLKVKVRK
jgi:phenylalanyl-tRNA synthetase beta chain